MRKSGLIAAAASVAACLGMGCEGASDASGEPGSALGAEGTARASAPSASAPVATTKIDRTGLGNVGTDKPIDYADPRMWLCRPGNDPDECDANLDATELLPDGTRKLVKHEKAAEPEVDCFYVYPTVKLTASGPQTDFENIEITLDALLAQAARFSSVCRVYAPLYRQNGVVPGPGGAPTPGGGFNLGVEDVRGALKYYLENLNHGRKFVLLGHSQGSGMLTSTIAQDVDPKPEVRAKLLSAFLIGAGVSVPVGQKVGGTFKNIPLCTEAGETGCVVAYVSYSKEVPPGPAATFGRATAPGQQAACTEPAALAGRAGQRYAGSYVRLKRTNAAISAPTGLDKLPSDITTPYVLYRDVFRGTCKVSPQGTSYLEIALEQPADDKRPAPPYRSPGIEAALGLHLVDYNLPLDDLLQIVRLQTAAAKK